MRRSIAPLLALALALTGCAQSRGLADGPTAQRPFPGRQRGPENTPVFTARERNLPGRFEVVGRGPITNTHTSDLWVFRGRDGRDYAYVSTWGACRDCVGNRMYVYDVTEPSRPTLTDSVVVDARIVNDVMVNREGTLASITREGASSRRNGVVLLDLSTPAHPKVASEYWENVTGGVHNSFIDGKYLYAVHDGTADLHIIDISDLRDPQQVGRWGVPTRPDKYLHDVWVEDGLAYLAYWDDGLIILDVGRGIREGTPQKPQKVGQYKYTTTWRGQDYGNTHAVFPYTNRAGRKFVVIGDEIFGEDATERLERRQKVVPGGFFQLVDVTDVTNPRPVAYYEVPGAGSHNIWVANDTLYVAYYNAGLRAVDISGDPRGDLRAAGREIAALATTDERAFLPNDVFTMAPQFYRGHVFAADFNTGLWVTRLVPNPNRAAGTPGDAGGRSGRR